MATKGRHRRGDDARRVTETESGGVWSIAKETRYMGGQAIYFGYSGGTVQKERETFFVSDSGKRMCILETTTVDSGTPVSSPTPKVRYQLDDHLGSACVELDASAKLISYEEYYPYGTTSYQAKDTYLDGYPKRYRYSGKERDEESGLVYYGARYLAPWLCRWTSPDPGGTIDGLNLWNFVNGDPVGGFDANGMEDVGLPAGTHEEQVLASFEFAMSDVSSAVDAGEGAAAPPRTLTDEERRYLDAWVAWESRTNRRIMAGISIPFNVAEVVIGAIGIAAPEPLSSAGGAALATYGTDQLTANIITLITGDATDTIQHRLVEESLELVGVSEPTADTAASLSEVAAGLGLGWFGGRSALQAREWAPYVDGTYDLRITSNSNTESTWGIWVGRNGTVRDPPMFRNFDEATTMVDDVGRLTQAAADEIAVPIADRPIRTYSEGASITANNNRAVEAHHLLEQRHHGMLFGTNASQLIQETPSVVLTADEHRAITNVLQEVLPYGERHSTEAILTAYEMVYSDYPHWMDAIRTFLRTNGAL